MRLLVSLTTTLMLGGTALAQDAAPTPPPAPCSQPEYRQLDFWVGDWDLTWDNGDGTEGTGRNTITRTPYGDCVITEDFDGTPTIPLKGRSVSTYSRPHGKWRQTWVDNSGGYYALTGGPQADGIFILVMDRLDDKGPHSRMVFKDITEDSLVWHWQGKRNPEDDWADQWVIRYQRR